MGIVRENLIFVVMFICLTNEANADEARQDWECKNDSAIMSMQGGHLSMVSRVESLERCYFVLTQENSGEQCCYNLDGFSDDCEKSEDYKRRNNTKCAKENVEIRLDSEVSGTCNLTIKSVSENSAGRYKSYEADHTALAEEFCVIVSGQKEETSVPIFITLAVVLAVVAIIVLLVAFAKKQLMVMKPANNADNCYVPIERVEGGKEMTLTASQAT